MTSTIQGPRGLAVVFLASVLVAAPAVGELAILSNGEVLKIREFEVDGDRIRLGLATGGELEISLLRVERIVDDEIEREPETGPGPGIPLAFEEHHQVPSTPYGDLIYEVAREHSVNPELVAAMVRWESAFDPTALSIKGARGLMQVMPATGQRFGVPSGDLYDPAQNLQAGVRYLRWLRERFSDDLGLVLAAYNAGEGSVDRYAGVPPYRETHQYIQRIYSTLGGGAGSLSPGARADGL